MSHPAETPSLTVSEARAAPSDEALTARAVAPAIRGRDPAEVLIFGLPRTTAAMIVMFLVAIDGWVSLVWIGRGWGYELNPAMAWLAATGGASLFLTAKLLLSALCMLWVVRRAERTHARAATCCAFAIYGGVVLLHIYNALTLGDNWPMMVMP